MERLKVGQEILLYNIVNETESTKRWIGSKNQTFIGVYFTQTLARIRNVAAMNTFVFHLVNCNNGYFIQEVKPVGRFKVRRLHNTDPITII